MENLRRGVLGLRAAHKGGEEPIEAHYAVFSEACQDDLNMPRALAALWGVLRDDAADNGAAFATLLKMDARKNLEVAKQLHVRGVPTVVVFREGEELQRLTPQELEEYFRKRLAEQMERHDGGNRWIGTGGTSPVGHSGFHPGGMRVGGTSRNQSAIKVALERRYKDYSQDTRLGPAQISDALQRLRHMVPAGPKDNLNIDKTIYQTMKNAGEIEIVFDRALRDKLKMILMIDNGGFSMDPYVHVVQVLFNHAKSQFKDIKFFYFHNTIYSRVWADPQRHEKPVFIEDFTRFDPETRLTIVGDASMAPWELYSRHGNIYYNSPQQKPSMDRLEFLAKTFKHSVWLNPKYAHTWLHTETIEAIETIFPMFELTLAGLEGAVAHLMKKN